MAKDSKTTTKTEETAIPEVADPSTQQLARPSDQDIAAAQALVGQVVDSNEQVMQTFVNWLTERAETTDEDQFAIMASILKDVMESSTPEEVLRERSTLRASEVIGVPLLCHGFEIREGDYEESMLGHYAALSVSRPGSETTRVLTTGATKVLMKLYVLDRIGEWPQVFWFTSKAGKKGNILDIVRD